MLTVTIGGIVAGVLLISTGVGVIQFVGALCIGLALLVARAGTRFPDAGWASPPSHFPVLFSHLQSRTPRWLWPLCVALLVLVLGLFLVASLLVKEELSGEMLGNLGKGLIALAMIATLVLWSSDLPALRRLIPAIRKRSGGTPTSGN